MRNPPNPHWLRSAIAALAVLWLGVGPAPARADAAAGRQAYDRGDYGRAMAEWQTAADKKDPAAELGLGNLYEFGAGDLAQDYRRAAYWYQKAAEHGDVEALYRLSLIDAAGGDNFPSDLAEAEKWADLAARSHGVWGSLATDFKKLLDQVTPPAERTEGKKRAAEWETARAAAQTAPAIAAPAVAGAVPPTAAQPPAPAGKSGGCPGWPFPTLPCTEQFPALGGVQGPPAPPAPPAAAQQAAIVPPPKVRETKPPLVGLNEALSRIDCAALHGSAAADGAAIVTGTVPDVAAKAKLLPLAAQFFPGARNEVAVGVVPPPICRSLAMLNLLQPAAAISGGAALGLRLGTGGNRLREGDPIALEVRGPDYPVDLRLDYYSLDGRVLHLKPAAAAPPPRLAAGATQLFGDPAKGEDWRAGGAPFGTELIAAVASPVPLDLGVRPQIEEADRYLRDLKRAVDKLGVSDGHRSIIATLLVETSGH